MRRTSWGHSALWERGRNRIFGGGFLVFQAQSQGKEEAGRLLARSTLDYFRQDLDRLTPELLWKKAADFSERVFGEQETRAASISCLKQMVNFCIEKEDFENEVKIVRALAEYGKDAESQNRMGVLYNRGIGLERNDLAALYWFNKAEEQGNAGARADCDGISRRIPGALAGRILQSRSGCWLSGAAPAEVRFPWTGNGGRSGPVGWKNIDRVRPERDLSFRRVLLKPAVTVAVQKFLRLRRTAFARAVGIHRKPCMLVQLFQASDEIPSVLDLVPLGNQERSPWMQAVRSRS